MKYFITAVLLSVAGFVMASSPFVGRWINPSGDGVVEIYQEGNHYFGKLVELIPAQRPDGSDFIDDKNPDKSKRTQKVLGLVNFKDFVLKGTKLEDGTLYDPKSGKTYDGKMWIEDGKLNVRGYIGFFYETQVWQRQR